MAEAQDRPLRVGDTVIKPKGYEFDSIVRSVFVNGNGDVRVVCESTLILGMLHIFSPSQLERVEHGRNTG